MARKQVRTTARRSVGGRKPGPRTVRPPIEPEEDDLLSDDGSQTTEVPQEEVEVEAQSTPRKSPRKTPVPNNVTVPNGKLKSPVAQNAKDTSDDLNEDEAEDVKEDSLVEEVVNSSPAKKAPVRKAGTKKGRGKRAAAIEEGDKEEEHDEENQNGNAKVVKRRTPVKASVKAQPASKPTAKKRAVIMQRGGGENDEEGSDADVHEQNSQVTIPKRRLTSINLVQDDEGAPCVNFSVCRNLVNGDRVLDKWCERCLPWVHYYKVPETLFDSEGSDECVFCDKLNNGDAQENMEYENKSHITKEEWDETIKNEPKKREMPKGYPSEWTYFMNHDHEYVMYESKDGRRVSRKLNVKTGDCVYLMDKDAKGQSHSRVFAMRVQYIVGDVHGKIFISGYDLYNPRQVADRNGKARVEQIFEGKPKMMFTDTDNLVWSPLEAVTGELVLLFKQDFDRGWPIGTAKQEVFYLSHDFSWYANWIAPLDECDYPACTNEILFGDAPTEATLTGANLDMKKALARR
ncbi:hypothetical protein HDE_14480 [Halotydeus destructor]|nr:hypothetical protein HDE_14480 [Halotydeus destructor]